MQADRDWGRDAWLTAAARHASHTSNADLSNPAAAQSQPDYTNLASALDPESFRALQADCTGLLLLYFTCVPPVKQVQLNLKGQLVCRQHLLVTRKLSGADSQYLLNVVISCCDRVHDATDAVVLVLSTCL